MKALFSSLFFLILTISCWSQPPLIINYKNKQTVVAANGTALLPHWYNKVKVVVSDVFLLESDGGKGVYDDIKVIIPCEYTKIEVHWQDGNVRGYMVCKNDRWAYFDRKGVRQTEFLYTGIKSYYTSESTERKGLADHLIQFVKDGKSYLFFQENNGKFTPFSVVGATYWDDMNGLFIGETGDLKTLYAIDPSKRKLKVVQKPAAGLYEFRKDHYYFIDMKDQMKKFTYGHKLVGSGPLNWNTINSEDLVADEYDIAQEISEEFWEGKVNHEWLYSEGLSDFANGTESRFAQTMRCIDPSTAQLNPKPSNVEVIQKGKKFYAQRTGTDLEPVQLKYKKAWLLAPGYSYIGVSNGKKYGVVDEDGELIIDLLNDEVSCSFIFGSLPVIEVTRKDLNGIGYYVPGKGRGPGKLNEIGAWDLSSELHAGSNMCLLSHTDTTGRKLVQPIWPITKWYDCSLSWELGYPCDSIQADTIIPGVWISHLSGKQGIEIPYLDFQIKPTANSVMSGLQFDMHQCSKTPLSHNIGINVCTVEATKIRADWYNASKEQWKTINIDASGYESARWLESGTVLVATQADGWSDLFDREGKPLLSTQVKVLEGNQHMLSITEQGNFLIVELKSGQWKALDVCTGKTYALPLWAEK